MSMMDSDFDAWFQSLSPEDQQFVLYQMGLGDANAAPPSFGTLSPELSGQEYDLATYQGGFPTDYNSKGEPLPWGLDQASQAATLQKNRNSLLADQITGAMAGPGAYDPAAFEPRYVYGGDVLDTPGQREAAYYAQLGGGGFQSLIAEDIMNGTDPATAVAKVLKLAQLPDSESLSPEMRAQRDAVVASLAPAKVGGGVTVPSAQGDRTPAQDFAQKYDVNALYDFANQIGESLAKDPTGGFTDPATGVTYAAPPKEEWSAAAEKYRSLGLPFPTARYTDPDYTPPLLDEGRMAAQLQADQEATALTQAAPTAATTNNMQALLDQYTREAALRQQPIAGQQQMRDGRPAQVLGPVATGPGGGISPVRTPGGGQGFRPLAAVPSLQQPSWWTGAQGDMFVGDPANGVNRALLNFDFTGMKNAMLAKGGAETEGSGRLNQDAIKKQRGKQETARQARSKAIDYNQRGQGERDAAFQLGQALALDQQGRTPLTDAMLKRLMTARAQGY